MKLIGITSETIFEGEAAQIVRWLECGLDQMHIRKPGYLSDEIATLLEHIPAEYHPRLILHDHFELAHEYPVGGLHLNRRNPVCPAGYQGTTGRSCHSLDEVKTCCDTTYCFLSPIYDSISKKGYTSHFPAVTLDRARQEGIINQRVYALGGIIPQQFPQIEGWGFGGAAMLGYLWEAASPEETAVRMETLKAYLRH